MNADQADFSGEKPLSKGSALLLGCAAGGIILLFYLFAAGCVLVLIGLLACDLVLVLGAARFGAAGPIARMMTRHMAPLPIFFRSFWIRKAVELRVALQRQDAPRLFRLLQDLCERTKVALPKEVLLEMSVNAWVRFPYFRRPCSNY